MRKPRSTKFGLTRRVAPVRFNISLFFGKRCLKCVCENKGITATRIVWQAIATRVIFTARNAGGLDSAGLRSTHGKLF